MRYPLALLFFAALLSAGCSSGPSNRDSCMPVEATANAPAGGNAASAAAKGGTEATAAPFSGVAGFRTDPATTIGRGSGDTSSASEDSEHLETASGAAMNIALLNPTSATATAGGGTSAAVQEAAKSVSSARRAYAMACMDPGTTDARLEFLADQVTKAQEILNTASASSRANYHYTYNMGGDNTMIGVGTAKTGTGEGLDPKVVSTMVDGAEKLNAHRSLEDAPADAESPEEAPAGPAVDPLAPSEGGE